MLKAKLKKIVFPDSGVECYVPNISLAGTALRVQRKHPRPKPPMQKVSYGGQEVWEVNYAHPDYRIQLQEWQRFLELTTQDMALKRLYQMKLNAEQLEAVEEWKKDNPGQYDDDDTPGSIFFEEIAILTEADFMHLISVLGGANEEVIDSIQDSFQGDAE